MKNTPPRNEGVLRYDACYAAAQARAEADEDYRFLRDDAETLLPKVRKILNTLPQEARSCLQDFDFDRQSMQTALVYAAYNLGLEQNISKQK